MPIVCMRFCECQKLSLLTLYIFKKIFYFEGIFRFMSYNASISLLQKAVGAWPQRTVVTAMHNFTLLY